MEISKPQTSAEHTNGSSSCRKPQSRADEEAILRQVREDLKKSALPQHILDEVEASRRERGCIPANNSQTKNHEGLWDDTPKLRRDSALRLWFPETLRREHLAGIQLQRDGHGHASYNHTKALLEPYDLHEILDMVDLLLKLKGQQSLDCMRMIVAGLADRITKRAMLPDIANSVLRIAFSRCDMLSLQHQMMYRGQIIAAGKKSTEDTSDD